MRPALCHTAACRSADPAGRAPRCALCLGFFAVILVTAQCDDWHTRRKGYATSSVVSVEILVTARCDDWHTRWKGYATSSLVGVEPPHPPSFLGRPLPPGARAVARWKERNPRSGSHGQCFLDRGLFHVRSSRRSVGLLHWGRTLPFMSAPTLGSPTEPVKSPCGNCERARLELYILV
jgi:hypothetical protein